MEPVTGTDVFEQDPEMLITEQDDGSAIVDIPEEEEVQQDFYSNLAETLDTFKLNTMASAFEDLIEKDKEARKKRDEQYEEGIRRTGLGEDAPGGAMFEGASRAVHPVLAEGCVDFAARAIKELFPPNGPAKTKLFGKADKDKLERAKKKRDYLNFLFTKKMRSYRDEKEILLTQLPLGGSQYEKYYPDLQKKTYVMEFVPVDKVLLPYTASSFYDTPRLTHMVDLTRTKFEERVESGFYRDIRITDEAAPEETAAQQANDKVEGKEQNNYNEDGLRLVYEIAAEYDVEGDGVAPYIIHLDEPTGKIVAVYRNWAEDDEHKARLDWWVEDKFIPWRGAYGIGLLHLIGSLAGTLTGTLRALLDSGHINNSPGAVKLKGGRASGQNVTIEQTQVAELEAPPGVDDIRKVIMPLPFNPPSQVLFQLLEWVTAQAKGVVATAEEKIADASNQMPVGTALALIEQGSQVFSSIHARLHESQRRSFEIVCRLIHDYPNEEELAKFDLTPADFADNDDVQPVSDPRIFSEAQRYAQLQEQIKVAQMFGDLPWNKDAMARRALELLRIDGIEEYLPPKKEPISADPVTENFECTTAQRPPKAMPEQDHIAHLREHLRFILDPVFGAGPAVPFQALTFLMNHVNEHLMMFYKSATETVIAVRRAQFGDEGELVAAEAAELASQQIQQQLAGLLPALQQAQKITQSKTPQPPVDPAIQKTFEASMAEIKRKAESDAARLKFDQEKSAREMTAEQQQQQFDNMLEQRQQMIDQRIAELGNVQKLQIVSIQEEGKRLADELRAQIEIMKNDADNEQHQVTELLKNLQDNETELRIALQNTQNDLTSMMSSGPDFTPQVDQLNTLLATVEKTKSEDALAAVAEGIRAMIGQMNRPKMIIEDAQGRPVGIQ